MDYDVVVVGAGPAGSSTAYFLASAGRRVLLIDKDVFPREKLCGDCLTPRAVRVLSQMGVAQEVGHLGFEIRGCRIHSSRGGTSETPFPAVDGYPSHGVVIRRADLDPILARAASDAGATLLEGRKAVGVVQEAGRVVGVRWVEDGGETSARSRVVVGADGAHSLVARTVFDYDSKRVRAVGVAFRCYYEGVDDFGDWMEIYGEDAILPGVGWVFPLGGGVVNAGVGVYVDDVRRHGMRPAGLMEGFAGLGPLLGRRLEGARQIGRVRGARLLMGGYTGSLVRPGALLVGDAGGLVNPLTGEGMMYALESGRLAATAIDAALAADRGGTHDPARDHELLVRRYQAEIDRRLGRYFALGTRFIRLAKRPWAVNPGVRALTASDSLARLNLRFWVSLF